LTNPSVQEVAVDYTKSKEQVTAEVAALLIQEDFIGYMSTRLWEHRRYTAINTGYRIPDRTSTTIDVPSFSPELEVLGRRTLSASFMPPITSIRQIVGDSRGIIPIAEFTNDCREMMTLGYFMGTVISIDAYEEK
jgi:hypothetical protein